jgi:DNA-binding transcriptional ArsR family regulator
MKPAQIDDDTLSFSITLFQALAHPTRLRMVELLTEKGCTVSEVAEALGLLQPNASQHLAILSRAGVVKVIPDGASRCYLLRGPRITRIMELVHEFRQIHFEDLKNPPTV